MIIFNTLFVLLYLLFYGIVTVVTDESVNISFGIGLIRKRITLNTIATVKEVVTPWYYGWGIRYIPHGKLYNVSGLKGVELKFKNSEGVIRIGSKTNSQLCQEIKSRLK